MKKIYLIFCTSFFISTYSFSQVTLGASIGTYNARGASYETKGVGPSVRFEFSKSDRVSSYLDASLYSAKNHQGFIPINDINGNYLGESEATLKYRIYYLQLGIKGKIGRHISGNRISFFLGGGAAFCFVKEEQTFLLQGYLSSNNVGRKPIFGFHFTTGIQYSIKPFIVEMKGNLDVMTKPIVTGDSYGFTSTKLSILLPFSKGNNK